MKLFGLFLAVLLLPLLARADSIRCGSRIIERGSSSAELTAFCGAPAEVSQPSSYLDQIEVEIRTYNFGPNQLMERVRIENGVIVQINSLGYGYNEP